ncbi:MAG: ABC transporter permease [Actinobacteria bacterium]|nr:ABC transporter permease [Actinomycetota bacterium]
MSAMVRRRLAPSLAMARRSVRGIIRQPQLWAPSVVFPLFFGAVSSAAFDRTRSIPGFPEVDSFLTFILPATIIQGVMFGATSVGNEMAIDMENGFADRLRAAPVGRTGLLLGRLAGVMSLAVVQVIAFVGIFAVFGASVAGGLGAIVALVVMGSLLSGAIGSFALIVALRTGSVEAVNGSFPIFFAAVFMSSAFFPPELSGGWFETVARLNPVSWLVDASRDLVIDGFTVSAAATAVGLAAAGMAIVTAEAVRTLLGGGK